MPVYFFQSTGSGCVKIGFTSRDVETRRRELQTGNEHELTTLHVIPDADADDERALHAHFQHARMSGEWFELTDDLAAHVRDLQTPKTLVLLDTHTHLLGLARTGAPQITLRHLLEDHPDAQHLLELHDRGSLFERLCHDDTALVWTPLDCALLTRLARAGAPSADTCVLVVYRLRSTGELRIEPTDDPDRLLRWHGELARDGLDPLYVGPQPDFVVDLLRVYLAPYRTSDAWYRADLHVDPWIAALGNNTVPAPRPKVQLQAPSVPRPPEPPRAPEPPRTLEPPPPSPRSRVPRGHVAGTLVALTALAAAVYALRPPTPAPSPEDSDTAALSSHTPDTAHVDTETSTAPITSPAQPTLDGDARAREALRIAREYRRERAWPLVRGALERALEHAEDPLLISRIEAELLAVEQQLSED